ncbi:MAG: hypothetical protein MI922_01120 [Bacteroidales bacterium]|nr:hypothetical protein [Bacteroidales bacterium]
MLRSVLIIFSLLLLFSSPTYASISKYFSPTRSNSIIAPVEIEGKGLYSLVLSVQFLRKPFDKKPYTSDEYEQLMNRMQVEWGGVVMQKLLQANVLKIEDFASLQNDLNLELKKLSDKLKAKYSIKKDIEVVFSIYNIVLFELSKQ